MIKILNKREKYMPPYLFKYRPINFGEKIDESKHIDALINERIYLSDPFSFNDPYDSAFNIDIEKFKNTLVDYAEQILKKDILKFFFDEIDVDINDVENIDGVIDEINIDMSNSEHIFEDKKSYFYKEFLKKLINFKICCFSEVADSILMWSHYASEHQGFCIAYDTSKIDKNIKKGLFPVFYHANFFPPIELKKGVKCLEFNSLMKYKDWQYEKEWRLFSSEQFLSFKPSEIYLGVKFDDKNLDFFKDIAKEKDCKLYQMEMNYAKYSLEPKEIDL